MNSEFLDPTLVGSGVLALFGGVAVLMLLDHWCKSRDKDRAHKERLKALEVGQPLPDAEVAQAHAATSRAWAAGLTATFVPLGLGGMAIGATSLVFARATPGAQLPLIAIIWGINGLVSLVTVSLGLVALRRREPVGGKDVRLAIGLARRAEERKATALNNDSAGSSAR